MRLGVVFSVLLHAGIVAIAFISLPSGWFPDVAPEPVVPIEVISEADLAETTSVPAAAEEPEPEPEPQDEPPVEEEVIEPAPAPEVEEAPAEVEPAPAPKQEPEPEAEPIAPAPKPEPPKPEPKKAPKPKPKKKADELDLDALSALVDKSRDKQQTSARPPSEAPSEQGEPRARVGAGDRLSASMEAKMRAAVSRCWNASAIIGAPEPEKLVVRVEFELNPDGTINGQPRVANATEINLSGNRFWKVAEQQAVRAVVSCQPYNFLPADQYDTWKEFELNFDPSQMAGF